MRHDYTISVGKTPKKSGLVLFVTPVIIFGLLSATEVKAQVAVNQYTATNLVATIIGPADTADSSLVNPWGLANDPKGGPWWVADTGKGRSTAYSDAGLPFPGLSPIVVAIPRTPGSVSDYSEPIGVVNNNTSDFNLSPGVPSQFIFVTREGSIAGWNSEVDRREAVLVIDNSPQAVYTGAAIAPLDGQHVLLVANFGQHRIDAFGPDFGAYPLQEGAFTDSLLPEAFSPYNVQAVNGEIWITFARIGTDSRASRGEGAGYVEVFDDKGNFIMQLENGPWLDAPWGIALAPPDAGFGAYSGSLLVGNSGSGRIAAFDATSGHFLGFLKNEKNEPIAIPDLHGLSFGNGSLAGSTTTLYFTAGSTAGLNLFGSITPALITSGLGRATVQY